MCDNSRIQSVLFDLDGTLIDTAGDLHAALNVALGSKDLPVVNLEDVRMCIGHGARAMIQQALQKSDLVLGEADIATLHATFLAYYVENIAVFSRPFEGILDCLNWLHGRGIKCAVSTNKTQALAERVLETLNLDNYFGAIVGADRASQKKPAAAHLFETLDLIGCKAETSIMIGDSSTDARAAQNAAIPFVFMTYGYPDADLADIPRHAELSHAADIVDVIRNLA